ncbi:MAG: YigZ family protein, partial [Bacillota bacterium]|nr:YigZ family protein [Bacillota bacterium]
QEFKDYLNSIKKKHYDATHACSGFICNNVKRSNDDGEPSGTAGVPILNVLEKNNLNEMCAIVVRYFGGIKLGASGLIRAYSNAVSECLKVGTLVENIEYPKYSLSLSYDIANKIEHYIKNNTILLDTKYDENITYIFALDNDNKIETIKEYTKGIEPIYLGIENIEKVVK